MTEPEQWARDLLEAVHDASDMGSACGMVDCPQCKSAALTIQRAFEERTGQLIPAPSVDDAMVERVARSLAPFMEGGREYDQMPATRRELKIWSRNGMALINDATQDDAQEAATAAISAMQVKP